MDEQKFNPEIWKDVKREITLLYEKEINSVEELESLLLDYSKFIEIITEKVAWAYIDMTRDTTNKEYGEKYERLMTEIIEKLKPFSFGFMKKIVGSPYLSELDEHRYENLIRMFKNQVKLFRETNITLETAEEKKSQEYYKIVGGLRINFKGKDYTPQQMGIFLKSKDREERREAWTSMTEARYKVKDRLNDIYTDLLKNRNRQSKNADFNNYRDYKHQRLGRFDYTFDDCLEFHKAIKNKAVSVYNELLKIRKEHLKIDKLRPWDLSVNFLSDKKLKPFNTGKELINGVQKILSKLKPELGENIGIMDKGGYFDIESRIGKAPGGYNYPLPKTRIPFIFMNAVGLPNDLITLLHESGHATHSFLTKDEKLTFYTEPPAEVAELASMSMELITLDYLDVFYKSEEERKLAKFNQLEGIINFFPWMSSVDLFQHWVYTHPEHTVSEREEKWLQIRKDYGGIVETSGLEDHIEISWQKQLHIFEVPFYYIEYGIAQLGALQVWKNYKENPKEALEDYLSALKMGYSRPIPDIYERAGIKFDFSENLLNELLTFTFNEIEKLL